MGFWSENERDLLKVERQVQRQRRENMRVFCHSDIR